MTERDRRVFVGFGVGALFVSLILLTKGPEAAFYTFIGMGAFAAIATYVDHRARSR